MIRVSETLLARLEERLRAHDGIVYMHQSCTPLAQDGWALHFDQVGLERQLRMEGEGAPTWSVDGIEIDGPIAPLVGEPPFRVAVGDITFELRNPGESPT